VAVKKRLLMFEYVSDYVLFKEHLLPDTVLSMDWHSPTIAIGKENLQQQENFDFCA
jgi:hypothetical protein